MKAASLPSNRGLPCLVRLVIGLLVSGCLPAHAASQPNTDSASAAILTLLILVVIFAGASAFGFIGKPKVVPTSETSVRIHAIIFTLIALCVLCALGSIVLLRFDAQRHVSWAHTAFAWALLLPIAGLIFCYAVWYPLQLRKETHNCLSEDAAIPAKEVILQIGIRLREEMGLPESVKFLFSRKPNVSPEAMGWLARNAVVILPHNIWSIAVKAAQGNELLARDLLRLVLAHELAHLLHRDIRVLPVMSISRVPLSWAFGGIVATYFAVLLIGPKQEFRAIGLPLLPLVFFGLLFLLWMLRSAIAQRERFADTVASLYVNPNTVDALTVARPDFASISILEAFVFSLRTRQRYSHSFLGIASRARGKGASAGFAEFRKRLLDRAKSLTSKETVFPREPLSVQSMVAVGVLCGLLVSMFVAVLLLGTTLQLLSSYPHGDEGVWRSFPENLIRLGKEASPQWKWFRTLFPILTANIMVSLLFLPVREMPTGFRQLNSSDLFRLGTLLVIAIGVCVSVSACLAPSVAFRVSPSLSAAPLMTGLWAFLLSFFYSTVLTFRNTESPRRLKELFGGGSIGVAWCFLFIALVLLFATTLEPSSRLVWSMNALCVVAWLNHVRAFRWLASYDDLEGERLQRHSLLFWRQYLNRGANIKHLGQRMAPSFLFIYYSLTLFLPAVVAILLVLPKLQAADAAYRTNPEAWKQSLESQALESAALHNRISALTAVGTLFLQSGWKEFSPSFAVGLGLLATICVLMFTSVALNALRGVNRNENPILHTVALVKLYELFQLDAWRDALKARVGALLSDIAKKDVFVSSEHGIPMPLATCRVAWSALSAGVEMPISEAMHDWIAQRESATGGFAAHPSMESDLALTDCGLQSFRASNWSLRYPSVHRNWARRILAKCLKDQTTLHDSDWLEEVSLCIGVLTQLDWTPSRGVISVIVRRTVKRWSRSSRVIRETRHLLFVLDKFNADEHNLRDRIRGLWLPQHENVLRLAKPDSRLADIADLIWIVRSLFPDTYGERAAVQQAIHTIEKGLMEEMTRVEDERLQPSGWTQ